MWFSVFPVWDSVSLQSKWQYFAPPLILNSCETSVCSTYHHCIRSIRVLIPGMGKFIGFDSFSVFFFLQFCSLGWFFYGIVISNTPQCPPLHPVIYRHTFLLRNGYRNNFIFEFPCLKWNTQSKIFPSHGNNDLRVLLILYYQHFIQLLWILS